MVIASCLIFPRHCPNFLLPTVEKSSRSCTFVSFPKKVTPTAYIESKFTLKFQSGCFQTPILPIPIQQVKMRWNDAPFNCGEEFLNYRLPFRRGIRGCIVSGRKLREFYCYFSKGLLMSEEADTLYHPGPVIRGVYQKWYFSQPRGQLKNEGCIWKSKNECELWNKNKSFS